jgi:hypothetical protein
MPNKTDLVDYNLIISNIVYEAFWNLQLLSFVAWKKVIWEEWFCGVEFLQFFARFSELHLQMT